MEELIFMQNPWFEGKKDYAVEKWEAMKIRWIPKWTSKISLQPFSLNFVFGPRQVGKTTGIKLLISELLKKFPAKSIFYFDCTPLTTMEKLKKILDRYIEIKEQENIKSSFIFLDEVTTINGWWRIVKSYIDMGIFRNDVITVSGSSSIKLKGEAELFPGRRGNGKDVLVLPLSFKEFVEVKGVEVRSEGNIEKDMKAVWSIESKIRKEFENYVKCGGYPLSINENPNFEMELISSLESEILRAGKSLELSKEIIGSILRKSPSPLSFSTIGNDVGVSYKTVQEYVEMFKWLFILGIALFRGNQVKWRKERKFFFLDPFLAKTLSLWTGEKYLESAFYEWIVQSHLQRKFGSVYYYRNKFEIDCVAENLKVEVKIGKPHREYPKDVLVLDSENLPLFLAVL